MHQPIDDAEGSLGLPEEISNCCKVVRLLRIVDPDNEFRFKFVASRMVIHHPVGIRYTAWRWREWLATTKTVDPRLPGKWVHAYPGWKFECLADEEGVEDG